MMKFVFLCSVVVLCASHIARAEDDSVGSMRAFLLKKDISNARLLYSNLNRDKRSLEGSGSHEENSKEHENSHENTENIDEDSHDGEEKPSSRSRELGNSKESKDALGPSNVTSTETTNIGTEPSPVIPPNNNSTSQRCRDNSITPVSCVVDLDDDQLLPHPDDCQLFYQCVSSLLPPVCKECPANLHFNPKKKVCDYPEAAGCQTVQDNGREDFIQCKEHNGPYADLIPDPTACDRYYVCDWGHLYTMYCPDGLHFNPKLLVCDLPGNAGCQPDENILA